MILYIRDCKTNNYELLDEARIGDHIWYISDLTKFEKDYPEWKITKSIYETIDDIIACEVQK